MYLSLESIALDVNYKNKPYKKQKQLMSKTLTKNSSVKALACILNCSSTFQVKKSDLSSFSQIFFRSNNFIIIQKETSFRVVKLLKWPDYRNSHTQKYFFVYYRPRKNIHMYNVSAKNFNMGITKENHCFLWNNFR